MKSSGNITLNGVDYPTYEIEVGGELLTIASYDLEKAITKAARNAKNEEEKNRILTLDDELYCYMPPHILDEEEDYVIQFFYYYYD